MAMYCKQAFQKTFEDEVSKKAYLKACKWLAQNIYSNVELSKDVLVNILKEKNVQLPAFTVTVYMKSDAEEIYKDFCKKCKQLHTIFYSVNGPSCNDCKAKAYRAALEKDISCKANFLKEVLEDKE